MKVSDILPRKEKINKVVNFVLSSSVSKRAGFQTETAGKIHVTGKDINEKFDYDFIIDGLEITIDFNIKPMNKPYKVDEFWGSQIRIDVAGQKEDGSSLSKTELRTMLKEAMQEYLVLFSEAHHHYKQL